MPRNVGLRTEIILSLLILMGAALLFSGLLLLNLLERELVRIQLDGARQQLAMAARQAESLPDKAAAVRRAFATTAVRWFLVDGSLQVIDSDAGTLAPILGDLNQVRFGERPAVKVDYAGFYLPGRQSSEAVTITVPLHTEGRFAGALQAVFPLTAVREALARATRYYLSFLLLYGAVLLLFGLWLLGKTVVRPVRQLTAATARIAKGDLRPVPVPAGPTEITELAMSFNDMTHALLESRSKTENVIASLRKANDTLERTRDELVHSERVASVGHLAAGMAHEIGNPLGAIIGYLELLRSELTGDRERDIVGCASAEAQRIDRLVRELLDYARPDAAMEPSDPAAVLAEVVDLLTHQGALVGIAVENRVAAPMGKVGIDRHRLLQVFVNLLVNARDAVRAARHAGTREQGRIRLDGGRDAGEIWVAVSDSGGGIDPAVLPHIFDPFFTTKPQGEGRGLGLAVCHRIVGNAGGRLEVQSGEEGSAFTVRLRQTEGG